MHIAIAKCDLFLYYCNAKEISFYYFRDTKLYTTQMYFFFFRSRFRKLHEKSDFNKIENAKIYVYFIKENLSVFTSCLHRLRLFLLLRKIFLCLEHVSLCLVYYSNKRKNRSPSFLNKWKK